MTPHRFEKILLLIVAVPCAVILLGLGLGLGSLVVHGQTSTSQALIPSGPHTCEISSIGVYAARIHVNCKTAVANTSISSFAARTNAVSTVHFLALLNTAYMLRTPVNIYYLSDPAQNPPDCLESDCRSIDTVVLAK